MRDLTISVKMHLNKPTNTNANWWSGPGFYVRIYSNEGYENHYPVDPSNSVAYARLKNCDLHTIMGLVGLGSMADSAIAVTHTYATDRLETLRESSKRISEEIETLEADAFAKQVKPA